jgi:hypothetical protein
MTRLNIQITEGNGDLSIYPEADSINIDGGVIEIAWDDERAEHSVGETKEVVIKPSL